MAYDVSRGTVYAKGHPVPRELRDRFADTLNVKDFGARGDGVTDDTAAIQAALDAVAAKGGGRLELPPGTYVVAPSGATVYLKVPSNCTVFGHGAASVIKVKDDAGDYMTVFGQSTGLHTYMTLRDFKVDQNAAGNTTCNIVAGVAAKHQYVAYFTDFDGATVEDLICDPATGVNTLSFNGAGTKNGRAVRNRIHFVEGHAAAHYDNSAIYMECTGQIQIGNSIEDDSGGFATSGIETHGGPAVVQGNVIKGYQIGINVVTQSQPLANSTDYSIVGNTVTDAVIGIDLWSINGYTLRNVLVQGNAISLNQATRSAAVFNGVMFANVLGIAGAFDNIQIIGNTIRLEPEERGAVYDWSNAGGIGLYPQGDLKNIVVRHNTVQSSPVEGIRLSPATTAANVVIDENTLIDCGNDSTAGSGFRAALFLSGVMSDVDVQRNIILDTQTPCSGFYSVIALAITPTRVRVKNNVIAAVQGSLAYSVPASIEQDADRTASAAVKFSTTWPPAYLQAEAGDMVLAAVSPFQAYRVTARGTWGPALPGVTGSCTIGTATATLSSTAGVALGDVILIAGSLAAVKITRIYGNQIDVDTNFGATVVGGAVSFWAPTYIFGAGPVAFSALPVAYGASMTPDVALYNDVYITVTDANNFTINNPTNGSVGQLLTVHITNTSGGALGVATWGAAFKMAAWTQPGSGTNRSITFINSGANWYEISRTAADVPN